MKQIFYFSFVGVFFLVQALMSLFVLASKDGWVNIMYHGLDAVAVDQQVCRQVNNILL